MDKAHERETRDFMNVESFSQLPFIRPTPTKALKEKIGNGAIRLFGQEFGTTDEPNEAGLDNSTENEKKNLLAAGGDTNKDDPAGENTTDSTTSSNRKFECHYCCRNFPTSQALGGHQNAHKRERQHAKRTHLQSSSSMMHAAGGHHVYGLINYNNRFGSGATMPMGYGHLTWNASNGSVYNSNTRLYSSHAAYNTHHEPINGSPLALWRIPSNTYNSLPFIRDRPLPVMQQQIPLLFNTKSKDGQLKPLSTITGNSESRFGYGSKQDNVSLDLHL